MPKANVNDMIGALLESIKTEKQAAEKGTTTHPSKNVDDGTVSAPEGARSSENTSDIKKNVGGTVGVAGQSDAGSASQSQPSDSIGTQSQASDEVKGNVPTPKAAPEKPGQGGQGDASPGHPTNQTFSEKYSSTNALANQILAGLAVANAKTAEAACAPSTDTAVTVGAKNAVKVEPKAEKKEEKKAEAKPAEVNLEKDAEAGYLAAKALYEALMQKTASNNDAENVLAPIVKSAQDDAVKFCEFMKGYENGDKDMNKTAAAVDQIGNALYQAQAVGLLSPEMLKKAADDLSALTGQQVSPEMLQGAMGGGGGGEVPPEAMGGMGGAEGGMGAEDPQIQAIAQELAQAGITPEELIAAIQGAGGGGEMGGMGGGAPAGGPPMGGGEVPPPVTQEAAAEGESPKQEQAEQKSGGKEEKKEEKEEEKEGAAKVAAIVGAAKKLLEKRKA